MSKQKGDNRKSLSSNLAKVKNKLLDIIEGSTSFDNPLQTESVIKASKALADIEIQEIKLNINKTEVPKNISVRVISSTEMDEQTERMNKIINEIKDDINDEGSITKTKETKF